jgi:hypothetical protein
MIYTDDKKYTKNSTSLVINEIKIKSIFFTHTTGEIKMKKNDHIDFWQGYG